MADLNVTIVLPAGGARTAEVPDDVPIRELVPELVSVLELPTTGPDGRPMGYRLDSKALGRELRESETLAAAGVPQNDRLMITADVTAGAARSLVAQTVDRKTGFPPEKYIVTFKCKSIIGIDGQGNPRYGDIHKVAIYLHNEYPQRWPGLKWLTPIWHPNIKGSNGSVCIDAAWWTAARSLDRLVVMLGEMAQWKNYHDDPTKPPFPWDAEAARWSMQYRHTHPGCFPVDTQELLRPETVKPQMPMKSKKVSIKSQSKIKTKVAPVKLKARPKIKLK